MQDLTFLFTDVEGSTHLWERHEKEMRQAIRRHDEIAAEVIAQHSGTLVKERGEGDSLFVVFPSPIFAVRACIDLMSRFETEVWPGGLRIVTRAAIHTGPAELRDRDYYGPTINRCARLRGVANGAQILLSQASAGLVAQQVADDFSLRDLGEHQLKDLSRKENIFLIETSRYVVNDKPIRSLNLHPHNLPVMTSRYVARDSVSKVLRDIVLRDQKRLLTIVGISGVGKTRAALQLGADVAERFPGGVWLVACDELVSQTELFTRIADHLNIEETGDVTLAEAVRASLQQKPTCLILDGAEKLITADPTVGDAVESLLSALFTQVIITSLIPLGIAGEQAYSLKPLDIRSLDDVGMSPSEELFVEYARSRNAHFVYGPKNAAAIREICTTYDGLPLALELVASLVSAMTPAEIVEELRELGGMGAIEAEAESGSRTSLRSALDWSYSLLSPDEQDVFERLSIFVVWFGRDAAGQVLATNSLTVRQIRPVLRRLVEKSLIQATEGDDGLTRYRMIGSVREFSQQKLLKRGPDDELRRRHLRYYSDFCRERDVGSPSVDLASVLGEVNYEMENNVAAWRWGMTQPDAGARKDTVTLAGALSLAFYYCGRIALGREVLNESVRRFGLNTPEGRQALGDRDAQFWAARILNGQALLHLRGAQYSAAEQGFLLALDAWEEIGELAGRAAVASNIGLCYFHLGRFEDALQKHLEALEIRKALGRQDLLAISYNNLAMVYDELGDRSKARAMYEDAVLARKRLKDSLGMAECMHNIARLYRLEGDTTAALHAASTAYQFVRGLGTTSTGVMIDDQRSHLLLEVESPSQAADVADRALAAAIEFDMPESIANLRTTLAIALWVAGKRDRALSCFIEAVLEANVLGSVGPRDRLAVAIQRLGVPVSTLISPAPDELATAEKYWEMSPVLSTIRV